MHIDAAKPLVNFRVSLGTLNAFDDACRLAGSSRTDILTRLMKAYTEISAQSLPKQLAEERRSFKTLRAAVERASIKKRALEQQTGQSAFRGRPRKSFTEFLAADPFLENRS